MYDFLTSLTCMVYACGLLVMICHWHGGFPRLTVDFPSLDISWIAMESVALLHYFFLVGSHISLAWVELIVPRSPVIAWVELLVLEASVGKVLYKPLVG